MLHINGDQADFWGKSEMGARWLTFEDQLDHLFQPVLQLVLERAGLSDGMKVLDIGCGTGASALAAAERVGASGEILGVDISDPFLARAKDRADQLNARNVRFHKADAQIEPFEDGAFDAVISRFGVMFFEDPTAALTNIGRALKPGGTLTFAAWGGLSDNPWFRVPHIAATKRLGQPPKVDRNAPGPLAFHDRDRVAGLMTAAGLTDVSVTPVQLNLTGPKAVEDAALLCTRVGPAARVIAHFNGTDEDVRAIIDTVAQEFADYHTPQGTAVPAVINLLQARRSE
ncbi:class I SAM-dependent methyltransferase [Ruegeria sp.]|uniref:class I SAM-dependent methyltransferase n=1 Tax=Ruegeria sp. TaxID=1879320 RepID=UPI003B5A2937